MAESCCIRSIKHVYNVTASGQTILATVTNHPDAITEWINAVKADGNTGVRKVGFEIELNYNLYPIGTVQLCVDRCCLIIQLLYNVSPFPPCFNEFLGDSNNIFVGCQTEAKVKMLSQQVPIRVELMRMVDLMKDVPLLLNNKQKTFATYGLDPEKVEKDWVRTRMLSDVQVLYACMDVLFNLQAAMGIIARSLSNT